jgi:hypothetical protein
VPDIYKILLSIYYQLLGFVGIAVAIAFCSYCLQLVLVFIGIVATIAFRWYWALLVSSSIGIGLCWY